MTVPFPAHLSVEERVALAPSERSVLASPAARLLARSAGGPPYRLGVLARPPWPAPESGADAPDGPARLHVVDGRVRVRHARFQAEIDPLAREAVFYRTEPSPGGLAVLMRVALSCELPLAGSLPLHAAGVLLEGRGLAFFGPSGAGKSTLAGTFEGPVLSDELVAVGGEPFRLSGTGISGTLGERGAECGSGPLRALFELAWGDRFSLSPLPPRLARQRLLEVVQVPLETRLWCAALSTLGRLVGSVPVYRMAWCRSDPPWERLRDRLARSVEGSG